MIVGHELGHIETWHGHVPLPQEIKDEWIAEVSEKLKLDSVSSSIRKQIENTLREIVNAYIDTHVVFEEGQNPKDNIMYFHVKDNGGRIHETQLQW